MNLKNRFLYPFLIIGSLFSACDSFQEDVQPQGEQELELKNAISALPGTSLYIDLKRSINTSGAVKFQINAYPEKGTANIKDDAVLLYVPKAEFLNGQDFLSVDLLNSLGSVVDTDSIFINLVQSEDSLPCFNGALSEYYNTPQDQPVILTPLQNDGYCSDDVSGAVVKFQNDPEYGTLEQVALFTYKYTPEAGFVGDDEFMYELELIDNDGNSSFSLAQIKVGVHKKVNTHCDSAVYPFHHNLKKPLDEFYLFQPFEPHPLCDVSEWTVDSLYVESGQVKVTDDGMIKYFPGSTTSDYITYKITFDDQIFHNHITVQIEEDSTGSCPKAFNDEFHLYIVRDSIGTSSEPYVLDAADNDDVCTEKFTIGILDHPEIGVASISDDQQIVYYADEEFSGVKETMIRYQLCDGVQCDDAYMYLTLENAD